MTVERELGVGVIGCGGMGRRHAHNLHTLVKGARVVAVADSDGGRAEEAAAACGGARIFADGQSLIADRGVEAVVIASPDPTHAPLTLACLAAGKPVLCEKPLATSAPDALQVVEAEAGRRLVQVGFMRIYDPAHRGVKRAVDAWSPGRLVLVEAHHVNPASPVPRTLEEVVVQSAVHDLHTVRWLTGDEVEQVFTRHVPADPSRPETCRLVVIDLMLSGGCLAIVVVDASSGYGYEVGVRVIGEWDVVETGPLPGAVHRASGRLSQSVHRDWVERFEEAYLLEVQDWVAGVGDGGCPGPSAWDGYASLAVGEACLDSARSGRPRPVVLGEPPAIYRVPDRRGRRR
ncbi:MAG: Gfo/Idh/MocA family oxidoreductase [Acidimicrobiia bacterium]